MKKIHSLEWFEDHFLVKELNGLFICYGTCNGYDYSFKSDSTEMARLLAEAFLIKNGHLVDKDVFDKSYEIEQLKKRNENLKSNYDALTIESGQRYRSKLMSVYYMLDALYYTGTHKEKQVIITHHKVVLEKMINDSDKLPYNTTDDLPF